MTDGKLWRDVLSGCAIFAGAFWAGCGGGTPGEVSPPPPLPDFVLSVSPSSRTVSQGSTINGTQVSVQALNGFSDDVQITVSGMPAGITANPPSPFTLQSGSSTTILIGATASAAIGSAAISVQGVSGDLSHSKSIALTVESSTASTLSRATYIRTDAQSALDDPPGEPHHQHMVYDAVNRRLFIANRARNRVEVLSTLDGSRVGAVDVAGASSADISADGKTVWVGTLTEQIVAIDADSLQRFNTYQLQAIIPAPNTVFDRPEEVIALSGGKLLVRLRHANAAESVLALFDPSNNSLTDLTPLSPQVFQNGVGVMASSADHTRVLVASNDNSGTAMILEGSAGIATAAKTIGSGRIAYATANADGSRFAVILGSGNTEQVVLLDSSLNQLSASSITFATGLTFSRDGQSLHVAANQNNVAEIAILASSDLRPLGAVPDVLLQGVRSQPEAADETGLVFALNNRGVTFLDGSQTATFGGPTPVLTDAPALTPASGANAGGTTVTLSGQNFASNPVVRFGGQAASVTSNSASQLQASSPANTATGAVNVTAYFSNGAIALAPDAFSYGPQILQVLPNAGNSAGGDAIAIYGYGFGEDVSKIAVKFGSTTATIQKVEDLSPLSASLGLDGTYPFPLQRITLTAPAGSPGKADLSLSVPSGLATEKLSFQYLQADQVFAKAGFYKFILYDQNRQRVYLSNIDRLDVFDLGLGIFRAGILPPGGPTPNALIRQAALTPDASQLVVADFGAQSIYLINPDAASGSAVNVGGVPGDGNSGPVRVAVTSLETVFVGLSGYSGGNSGCSTCLLEMDLSTSPVSVQTAPQPQVSALTNAPIVDASTDGRTAFFNFASAPGQPMAAWNAVTPGQFLTTQTNIPSTDVATAADGSFLAARDLNVVEVRDASLALQSVTAESELEAIPQRSNVPGIALHPSGALIYVPFLTGPAPVSAPFTGLQGGVDILDAHTGRLRLRVMLPEPLAMLNADSDGLHGRFMAVDENGQRIFALTVSGLTVMQLARVPLGIGTVEPAGGTRSGGANLTIRGSGFQSGVKGTIGGKSATVTFVDMNTLKVITPALSAGKYSIVITNADGETYSLDACFTVN